MSRSPQSWVTGMSHLRPQRERRLKTERRPPAAAEASAVTFVDRYLEKHISPQTLTSNLKMNPLFPSPRSEEEEDSVKVQPSWTVEEYNTQTSNVTNLAEYLKVSRLKVSRCEPNGDKKVDAELWVREDECSDDWRKYLPSSQEGQRTPKDLDFWLEDIYTPGFDSLLKKTEARLNRRSRCRLFCLAVVSIGAVVTVIVVPVMLLRRPSWRSHQSWSVSQRSTLKTTLAFLPHLVQSY